MVTVVCDRQNLFLVLHGTWNDVNGCKNIYTLLCTKKLKVKACSHTRCF